MRHNIYTCTRYNSITVFTARVFKPNRYALSSDREINLIQLRGTKWERLLQKLLLLLHSYVSTNIFCDLIAIIPNIVYNRCSSLLFPRYTSVYYRIEGYISMITPQLSSTLFADQFVTCIETCIPESQLQSGSLHEK